MKLARTRAGLSSQSSRIYLLIAVPLLMFLMMLMTSHSARGQSGGSSVSVVSAASFEGRSVAPESLVSIFGSSLATRIEVAATQPLPTTLAGTSVKFKDATGRESLAPLVFVSPSQINCLIPDQVANGLAAVTVSSGDGKTSTGTVQIAGAAPGLFTANASGQGVAAAVALRITAGGLQVYESVVDFDQQNRPVPKPINLDSPNDRVFLIAYCTGVRRAPDPNGDGNLNEIIRVVLGGTEAAPIYAGIAPGFAGLDQVNVELPRTLIGRGVINFSITATGFSTSNSVIIEIAPPRNVVTPPRVTSFGPNPVLAGGTLSIEGSNFDPTKEKNLALIAGRESRSVEEATTTRLSVKVPFGAMSGKIAVRTAQGQGESATEIRLRTSISGYVETTGSQPLAGMIVRALDTDPVISTTTDNQGAFVLADVPASSAHTVEISPPPGPMPLPLPVVSFKKRVEANRDNHTDRRPIQQIQLTGQNALPFGSTGFSASSILGALLKTAPASIAQTRVIQDNGVMFEIADNATATFPGGVTSGTLFLNLVERSRTPVELPPGVFSSIITQLTPFGVKLSPGGKLSFPNADRLPVSSAPRLYRFDQTPGSPTLGQFVDAGAATVTADGQRVETAPNAIIETSIFFVAVPQPVTTVIGRVVENDGSTPVRGAIARANGQEATTDGNGGFTLRNVSVSTSTIVVEASFQRPNGRVDRAQSAETRVVLNGLTNVGNLVLPPQPPNRPPVIFAPARLEVTEGLTLNVPFLAYDQDTNAQGGNQAVQVSLSSLSFATLIANGGNSYTLRLAPKTGDARAYTLTITATDDAGLSIPQPIQLTVNPNRAPVLAAPASRVVLLGQTLSFNISATDLDNTPPGLAAPQTFTFSSPNLPPGATLTTLPDGMSGRFDWTPAIAGTFTPSFIATDNGTPPLPSQSRSTTIVVVAPWAETGSAAGRIEAAQTFALLSAGTNLFAATSGGVFLSTNQGLNWTARNNGLTTQHVNALALDGATLLAATNGGGVFRSTDSGQNWTTCGNLPNGVVRALLVTSQGLFAGTSGGGVFRSPDGCQTWTPVNFGLTNLAVNTLTASGSTLYAGTEGGGVFSSTNNGQSWQPVNSGLTNPNIRTLAVSPSMTFAGTDGGGVYCSANPAQGWSSCNNGLTNPTINALTVSGSEVFACTSGDGVFRSTDQGATWSPLSLNGLKNPFVASFAVNNANNYFAGTAGGGVFTSTNQGQNWAAANTGLATSTVNTLIASGATLYAGTAGGGVFTSTDQGQSWIANSEGLTAPFVNAFAVAGGRLFAATNGGVFSSPLTSPLNWTANNTGLPEARYAIPLIAVDTTLYVGIAPAGGVYRSDDLGQSWRPVNAGMTDLNIQSLTASSPTLLAGTENGGIFRSTNGGQTWTSANSGLTGLRVHALTAGAGVLYAGTNNGVHRSADQGQTWTPVNTGLPNQAFVNTLLVNGSALYAGIFGGVFLSLDQGQTWTAVNTALAYNNVFSLVASGSNLFAGTIGGGVYVNASLGSQ